MKDPQENINKEMIEGASCDACANCGKVAPICQCWKKPDEIEEPSEEEN